MPPEYGDIKEMLFQKNKNKLPLPTRIPNKEGEDAVNTFKKAIRNLQFGLESLITNVKFYEVLKYSREIETLCAEGDEDITKSDILDMYNDIHLQCLKNSEKYTNCACNKKLQRVVVVMEYNHNDLKFKYIIGSACIKQIENWVGVLLNDDIEECKNLIDNYEEFRDNVTNEEYKKLLERYKILCDQVSLQVKQKDNKKCIICRDKTVKKYEEHKPPYGDMRRLTICKNCIIDHNTYRCFNYKYQECSGKIKGSKYSKVKWMIRCPKCYAIYRHNERKQKLNNR